jgi:hypothetical protein
MCDFPKCRNIADYGYVERSICEAHWRELCVATSKTEKSMLKKIGLIRDGDGVVVMIIQKEKDNG